MGLTRVKKRGFLFIASAIIITTVAATVLISSSGKPPTEKIEAARVAISEAVKVEANIYSKESMEVAERWWRESMEEWRLNNEKSRLFRSYEKAEEYAQHAIEEAVKARKSAIITKKELKRATESTLAELRKSISYIQLVTSKLPINHNIRKRATPFTLKLNEAEQAYRRDDLLNTVRILDSITPGIEKLKKTTSTLLEDYFRDYPEWIKLDKEMRQLSASRGGGVTIVVDKFSRRCIVYKSGKKYREFDVELGVNWLGDKVQRGDKATPEGRYSVTVKKSGRNTIYYKALLINFPNKQDLKRFNTLKASGKLPRNANIGGLIEIHGGGGKGIDWTDGCVALDNRDMDIVYSLCSVGTQIAIVGSLSPLEKILDSQNE